jgi:hypothetical protein
MFVLCAGTALADDQDAQAVIVKVHTVEEIDGQRSSRSTTRIATVAQATIERVELDEGYLVLSVIDERRGEYSVRVDHYDLSDAVLGSRTMLTSESEASFFFSSDRIAIEGTVSIEGVDE